MISEDELSRERRRAWEARNYGPLQALEAVLLFHGTGPWDSEKRQRWWNLTFSDEATTRVLCEFVRYCYDNLKRQDERDRAQEW